MATTNLYAVHAGKNGDALKAVKRVIGYVENSDKTKKKKFITQTSHTHIRHSHRFLQASAAKKYQTVVGAWMKCW